MTWEYIEMSQKEVNRLKVIEQIKSGQLKQKDAALLLGLSSRQLRRLQAKYKARGAKGLVSGHRGKASNHQLLPELRQQAIHIIATNYADFGPTLAAEYLQERHSIKLSVETVRQLMIKAELWHAKSKKKVQIHQQRLRRPLFGELIQLDGSHHDWFEGRSNKCCLLVLIDDATSAIVDMQFCHAETTQNYFQVVRRYLKKYGLPMAFYSDKHSIFRVNQKEANSGNGLTQFGRAMEQLGIELIHAHSPQAKGRVEKANSTLQDRLIKAMRIDNIHSIEQANAYLPGFIEKYNARFAKPPLCDANAHCELQLDNGALDHILCLHSYRSLSSNLECSYNNVTYQIQAQDSKYRLQRKTVLICEDHQGKITLHYKHRQLDYKVIDNDNRLQPIHDDKTLNSAIDNVIARTKKTHKTSKNSPWRNFVINPRKEHYRKLKQQEMVNA